MNELDPATRHQLIVLSRRSKSRIVEFSPERLADWRPNDVINPDGVLDRYLTDAAAWEFIADKLEQMHPVEVLNLEKPAGAKGYVMKIDLDENTPLLYVKLQLGAGKIIERSFHYSKRQ